MIMLAAMKEILLGLTELVNIMLTFSFEKWAVTVSWDNAPNVIMPLMTAGCLLWCVDRSGILFHNPS